MSEGLPRKIRVTLLGCGGIAENYREVYRVHPRVELVAACDVVEKAAFEAARGHEGALVTTDAIEALRVPTDLTVVSTPNDLHAQHTIAALEGGSSVLVQKPIARSYAESKSVLDVRERLGLPVGVYMSSLDNPVYHDMRKATEEGWFGSVVKFRLVLAHKGGLAWTPSSWRASSSRTGGGSWLMLAPHLVHLVQWISGQRIASVTGAQGRVALPHIEGDDITSAVATLEQGALVEITTGWSHGDIAVEVFGTEGTFTYRNDSEVVLEGTRKFDGAVVRHAGGDIRTSLTIPAPTIGSLENPLEQHAAAIDAVLGGKPFACQASEAVRDMRILDLVAQVKSSAINV